MIKSALAGVAVLGALGRTACAEEPPPVLAPPANPPAGAAQVALGLLNPLRTARFDMNLSGPAHKDPEDPSPLQVGFAVVPRWSFVDTQTDWAWVGGRFGWRVDKLLDTDDVVGSSSRVNVDDLELDVAYSRSLVRSAGGTELLLGPRLGIAFPTSAASQAANIKVRTSLGAGIDLHVPLLSGNWLRGLLFSGNGTWEHEIGPGQVPGQFGAVGGFGSPAGIQLVDQNDFFSAPTISGGGQLSATLGVWLTLYRDLSLGNTWGYTWQYYPSLGESACTPTGGSSFGSPCLTNQSQSQLHTSATIFDVVLGYTVADVVWLALGYNNTAETVHGTGNLTASPFNSTSGRVYGQVSVLFDGIYARARATPPPPPPPPPADPDAPPSAP